MPKPASPEQAFADVIRRKATQVKTSNVAQSNSIHERFAARVAAIARDTVTEPPKSGARGRRNKAQA